MARPLLRRFGLRVRELREAAGFSQESFGEACDLHRNYIGGIERGERNVALMNIAAIARALKTTSSELLRGVDSDVGAQAADSPPARKRRRRTIA